MTASWAVFTIPHLRDAKENRHTGDNKVYVMGRKTRVKNFASI